MVAKRRDPSSATPPTSPAPRRRKDPETRHLDASAAWSLIKDRDPHRHYVWAYRNDSQCGMDYYLGLGYVVEHFTKDGPKPVGGRFDEGAEIVARGYVLMSCDNERYENIRNYGPDGNTGLAYADQIEAKIVDRNSGGLDDLRGIRFKGLRAGMFDVRNTTSPVEEEYA